MRKITEKNSRVNHIVLTTTLAFVVVFIAFFLGRPQIEHAEVSLTLEKMNADMENSLENPYLIKGVEDIKNLADYSKTHTCEGMYFQVASVLKNSENKLYYNPNGSDEDEDISEGEGIAYHIDLIDMIDSNRGAITDGSVWYGIGMNYLYPFMGNIDFQGITVRTDTSMFGFLSDGAKVRGLNVFGDITSDKNEEYYGTDGAASIGGIASIAYITTIGNSVTVTNCTVTNSTITGSGRSVGGIIGTCVGKNSTGGNVENGSVVFNVDTCTVNADITCSGNNSEKYDTELGKNSTGETNKNILVRYPGFAGGLIGDITSYNGNYYVKVNITGNNQILGTISSPNSSVGGAIGHTFKRVYTEFDGILDLSNITSVSAMNVNYGSFVGKLVGSSNDSLMTTKTDFKLMDSSALENGSISGNGNVSEMAPGNVLVAPDFSDSSNIQGKGTEDSPYLLKNANDMMIFAAYMSSTGTYCMNKFDTSSKASGVTDFSYFRQAYFRIENNIDISGKGINSINRTIEQGFSGTLYGKTQSDDSLPVITNNIDSDQDFTALFAYVTPLTSSNVSFKDFGLEGNMKGKYRISGLAAIVNLNNTGMNGNVSVSNIDNAIELSNNKENKDVSSGAFFGYVNALKLYNSNNTPEPEVSISFDSVSYRGTINAYAGNYGGLVGAVDSPKDMFGKNISFNISNYIFSGTINVIKTSDNESYSAGCIGIIKGNNFLNTYIFDTNNDYTDKLYGPKINVNIENLYVYDALMKVTHDNSSSMGGFIGHTWTNVDANISGTRINDSTANFYQSIYGGLITKAFASTFDISDTVYERFNIISRNASSILKSAGMLGDMSDSDKANISDYQITDCTITGTRYFADIVANSTGANNKSGYTSLINLIGNDTNGEAYSTINPYVNRFSYDSGDGNVEADYRDFTGVGQLSYNVFSSDGSTYITDYMIEGTGTADNPFVIDSAEKLMVLEAMTQSKNGGKGEFLEYFSEYELAAMSSTDLANQKKNSLQKILTGYYLFASDIDLTYYSFYSIQADGGKYIGFNKSKYESDKGKTANISEVISILTDDEGIIDDYETSYSKVYDVFMAQKGESYVITNEDKATLRSQVQAQFPDIYEKYIKLKEFNSYKPTFTFAAEEIANSEKALEYSYISPICTATDVNSYQHRYIHSGLFSNLLYCKGEQEFSVNNICLSGTFSFASQSNNGKGGAALITQTGSLTGVGNSSIDIRNIDFSNVSFCAPGTTSTTSTNGNGLLISSINSSQVNIYGVTILKGKKIEADALIGYQYGVSSKTVLEHIDLNEAISETGYSGKGSFKYALFFYYFKEGMAIYWYDDGDMPDTIINTDIITPGLENVNGERRVVDKDITNNGTLTYSYKTNAVDINPTSANIEHGTGTADDPFIISNEGQFLSLYLAIKNKGITSGLADWYVGETKNNPDYDENDNTTWELNGAHNYVTWDILDNESTRLSKIEYLRTAHYAITKDLDLSNVTGTFEIAAKDFYGIGEQAVPFSGSFDGSCTYDESTFTLNKTLTHRSVTLNSYGGNTTSYYGMIRYANGVNVSNLTVKSASNESGYLPVKIAANAASFYGTVIGCIQGGDNVINNVNIKGASAVEKSNTSPRMGGMVGYVQFGTLTLANIDADSTKDFKAGYYNTAGDFKASTACAGGLVGKKEAYTNIFIDVPDELFSPDKTSAQASELSAELYSNLQGLPSIRSGYFLNQNYLDGVDKIEVTGNAKDGFVCHLKNAKQIYMLSLAYRCGAISVDMNANILPTSITTYVPYNKYSKTYKVDDIDNVQNYYPAIFEYFDFSKVTASYDDSNKLLTVKDSGIGATVYKTGYTMLNQINKDTLNNSNGAYRTTYLLDATDKVYDISTIDDFYGLGYAVTDSNNKTYNPYFAFASDFDGNANTIKIGISTKYSYYSTGFIGIMTSQITQTSEDYALSIGNCDVTGSLTVNVADNAPSTYYAGSFIGRNNTRNFVNMHDMTFKNLHVSTAASLNGKNVILGGVMANADDTSSGRVMSISNINIGDEIDDSSPEYGGVKYSVIVDNSYAASNTGGLMAYATKGLFSDITVKNTFVNGSNNTQTTRGCGILIGNFTANNSFSSKLENITISDSKVYAKQTSVGAIFGRIEKSSGTVAGNNITTNNVSSSIGTTSNASIKNGSIAGYVLGDKEAGFMEVHTNYDDTYSGSKPKIWTSENSGKIEWFNLHQFTDIESVETELGIHGITESNPDNVDAIVKYSDLITTPSKAADGSKEYLFTYNNNPVDLIPDNGRDDDYLVVEWRADAGTITDVFNSVLNTITEGSGKINEPNSDAKGNTNDNIDIEIIPMQVRNGVVSRGSHTPSLSASKDASGVYTVTNNNVYDKVEKDDASGNHIPGTYSLIKITYAVPKGAYTNSDKGFTQTVYIPFVISNMVDTEIFQRISLGSNFNESYMHNLSNMNLSITKDSSYTLYAEVLYSNNRLAFEDKDIYYVKQFILDSKYPVIPVGTVLTMVDATDGESHTYYYEVKDYRTSVRLTEFVDDNGKHYKERNIANVNELMNYSAYTSMYYNGRSYIKKNRGVEKFFIFVDSTGVSSENNITGEESVWRPEITNANGFTQDDYEEIIAATEKEILTGDIFYERTRCFTNLNTYNGRSLGFVEDSLDVEGSISKESTLTVSADFFNKASDNYWNNISNYESFTLNDYSNNGKYIEVAVCLVNEDGDKVLFPAGTRVKLGDSTQFEGIKNTSNVYYYKDGTTDGYRLMDVTSDRTDNVSIVFDFTYAKMENLPAGKYTIELDLVRTSNKDFPMGSELIDTLVSHQIEVTESGEYGFSLAGYNLKDLAVNDKEDHTPYSLNYNINLNSEFAADVAKGLSVTISYQLLKKNMTTGEYENYSEQNTSLVIGDLSASGYKVVKGENVINNGTAGTLDISGTTNNLDSQMQNIIVSSVPAKGVDMLSIPFTLTMPESADPVNYKIVATLISNDTKQATDSVIFNLSDIELQ